MKVIGLFSLIGMVLMSSSSFAADCCRDYLSNHDLYRGTVVKNVHVCKYKKTVYEDKEYFKYLENEMHESTWI